MLCKKCGSVVPDGDLVCRPCVARRGWEGIIGQQEVFMAKMLTGELQIRLARSSRAHPFHVALFANPGYAFCEANLRHASLREQSPYTSGLRMGCCAACLEVLDQVLADHRSIEEAKARSHGTQV